MKKTKLICTMGPSCMEEDIIKEMIINGMDVARINLSHCDHDFAEEIIKKIRKLNGELNTNVGILLDTKGPEIRVGSFPDGYIELKEEDIITLTPGKTNIKENRINISQKELSLDLDIDSVILLDEGLIELIVIGIVNADIMCRVTHGGILKNNRGLNVPNINLSFDFLSNTDKDDITFASKQKVEFIALSFVRNANDILDVNDMLIASRNEHTQIISKIENQGAIDDIDNIIKVSDGIMIARGDLGVEIELEKIPCIQKNIVKKTRSKNKICIVSTEMLASMEEKTRPTRAEVSDVANAVIDGVDAVMLSGETAVGLYPIESVNTMYKIIVEAEKSLDYHKLLLERYEDKITDITSVMAYNTVDAANMIESKAIVVSTMSGYTARKVSNYRPKCPIIATTHFKDVALSLSLNWGIIPVVVKKFSSTDEIIDISKEITKEKINVIEGDKIVITGGFPVKRARGTNFIKIEELN